MPHALLLLGLVVGGAFAVRALGAPPCVGDGGGGGGSAVAANLTRPMIGWLAGRIQSRIYQVQAEDSEGVRYNPLVAGYVRLAFHACAAERCGSYVDLDDRANSGLAPVVASLEGVWQSLLSDAAWAGFSKADLYAFAGVAAFEVATGFSRSIVFRYGRPDHCDGDGADRLGVELPDRGIDADAAIGYFRRMFGFTENETVALMGAHSLGVVHDLDGSGRALARWVSTNPNRLSNQYYADLLLTAWRQGSRNYTGLSYALRDWQRPGQPKRLMFNSDMGLVRNVSVSNATTGASACVSYAACKPSRLAAAVAAYAAKRELFLDDFAKAFAKLIEHGLQGQLRDVF